MNYVNTTEDAIRLQTLNTLFNDATQEIMEKLEENVIDTRRFQDLNK